ncbi:hypothetical protein DFJ58DRAFT_705948 [Suillus subalutaceus]|uniref:uncharacterized protein n=1 Tax=Suillus subalutaceus TaxID=48586 RepID=UPI001B87132C|nr:uncharacterized protein DFJ58DRAFT_705948 [Suillus subalutaceus]KAG1846106.1 hypothetical protein DFJ58DRAFT_705948 [Suillus subalutaceus]
MRQNGSPPPQRPSSSEADPLIGPGKPYRRYQSPCVNGALALIALLIPVAITVIIFFMSISNDHLDRDRIRKDWYNELRQHQKEVLERIDTQKRWLQEDNDRTHLREQWGTEVEKHDREMEERLKRDEDLKNRTREQWKKEEDGHQHEVGERRKHEEEERLRLNMFWTDPTSHTCTTYATREYTARLVNVPSYYNRRVEACMATPIEIHGIEYTPKWCEDQGPNNVTGHWEVDQREPDCASYWTWYKDFGCISPGSGQRRIEHYLENLPSGADWKEFCATTPVSFHGMHFMGAEFCFQKAHTATGFLMTRAASSQSQ